jgi:phospholipid-binding lipoprotein MlaA
MGPWGDPARRARLAACGMMAAMLGAQVGCAHLAGEPDPADPWERMNRGIFRFNEGADRWVIEPLAKGMDFILPDPVERSIRKFFDNAMIPIHFGNALLQFKPVSAVEELTRFVINTTIGVAGFFDPATHLGLEAHGEDFGQTLGYWGVPPGPYLVLPIFGPSNPRDTVGMIADSASTVYPWFMPFYASLAIGVGERLNLRSIHLETIAREREAALDYYVFVRNAFMSHRENEVWDLQEDEADEDDLYYFE